MRALTTRTSASLVKFLLVTMTCAIPVSAQTTRPATRASDYKPATGVELDRRVVGSMARAVNYLLSQQRDDGGWVASRLEGKGIGSTALATFAPLSAGRSHQSPAIAKAIRFLKQSYPSDVREATYCTALRICVWSLLPESMRQPELRNDTRWLLTHPLQSGPRKGMYNYGSHDIGDFSNSQYGVLGVWTASQLGVEVPRTYWQMVDDAWRRGQFPDGGWGYRPGEGGSYASMTAGGAATLYITNDYLHSADAQNLDKQPNDSAIAGAMLWLAVSFAVDSNLGRSAPTLASVKDPMATGASANKSDPSKWVHYMLFGYERLGEISGLTRWGQNNWYEQGANFLLKTQAYDGSWTGSIGPQCDTAYSLLFLSRGRAPVVAQKLQFAGRWNNRPRDVYGLSHFLRRATERHVNWQIIPINADPQEFRESPMLYIASDRAFTPNDQQQSLLKNYVDQGGLLVCVNEGRGDDFTRSIVELGRKLYPRYEFHDLPREHPLYTANFQVKTPIGAIRALGNGVRDLMVLFPTEDMSWRWHETGGGFVPQNSPYASLANLWLHITGRQNPRYRSEDVWVDLDSHVQTSKSLKLIRLRYDGNWDPEPGGWQRVANIMHNLDQLDLSVSPGDTPAEGTQIVHITATSPLKLSPEILASLRSYLNADGLLLMDAAGGRAPVAQSMEAVLRELYPGVTIKPLSVEHPVYRAHAYGGIDIGEVDYRSMPGTPAVHVPRLRGATVNGKLVAIVSYEDLSGALVGYATDGLNGYTTPSATDLIRNLILWRASPLR